MLSPRFVGKRFDRKDHPEIPAEVLKDIACLQDLLFESTKLAYRCAHPDEIRLPKNFLKGIYLSLTEIQKGSAIPVLALRETIPQKSFEVCIPWQEEIDAGVAQMFDIINDANKGNTLNIPPALAGKFASFGSSLLEDERIEFTRNDQTTVIFDNQSRKSFLMASNDDAFEEAKRYVGQLTGCQRESKTFTLKTISGHLVEIPYTDEDTETILQLLCRYETNDWEYLGVDCIVRHDKRDRLSVVSLVELETLGRRHVPSCLEEFIYLKKGWCSGDGEPFSAERIHAFSDIFIKMYPDSLPLPYIYPDLGVSGQILRFEWEFGSKQIQLEIQIDSFNATLYAYDLDRDDDVLEQSLDLKQEDAWIVLCECVQAKEDANNE